MDDRNPILVTITPLVRQYSLKTEEDMPDDTLSQALGAVIHRSDTEVAERKQQMVAWRRWIHFGDCSDDVVLDPLERYSQKVIGMWQKFHVLHPSENGSPQTPTTVPTISTLYEAIYEAEQEWNAKQVKGLAAVRGRFMTFADMMNDYSYVFKVIPSGDKYVSLITGVVSSVVMVSANYKKIAEGFSQALSDLSDHLCATKKIVNIADSPDMRRLVVRLYTEVFELLCNVLSWFTSRRKRISSSFNKNFYDDKVVLLLTNIEKTVKAIDREANIVSDNRILALHQVVVEGGLQVVDRLRPLGNQNRRDNTETIHEKFDMIESRMKEQLGYKSIQTLGCIEEHHAYDVDVLENKPDLTQQGIVEELSGTDAENISEIEEDVQGARYDIEKLSGRLAGYLDDGRYQISPTIPGDPSSIVPTEALLEMQKWIKAGVSKWIWVQGVPMMPHQVGLTHAALRICDISIQTGIPCVSFFCKRNYDFQGANKLTSKEASLVALLYSVISQLACLLPTAIPVNKGLEESDFRLLDGTMESVPVALKMIRALLTYAPPTLIWVINGLQLTETNSTIAHLRSFLDILREQETKRIFKACFITEGNCFVLSQATTIFERVDTLRMAENQPGATMRGGSHVSELEGSQ